MNGKTELVDIIETYRMNGTTKLIDVIETEDYGTIEIWSQDVMPYFFQDKMPQDKEED